MVCIAALLQEAIEDTIPTALTLPEEEKLSTWRWTLTLDMEEDHHMAVTTIATLTVMTDTIDHTDTPIPRQQKTLQFLITISSQMIKTKRIQNNSFNIDVCSS